MAWSRLAVTSPGVGPGQVEHPQDRLEDGVVADVGQRGEVALLVGEPVDRAERVERLDPDRLVRVPARPRPRGRPGPGTCRMSKLRPPHQYAFDSSVIIVRRPAAPARGTPPSWAGRLRVGDVARRGSGAKLGRGLAGREAGQAHVDRLAVLVAADLPGGVAAAVTQQLDLVAHLGADVGGAQEVAVHRVHRLAVGHRAHGGGGRLGDHVAAVRLRPRARLGDGGEGQVEVLRLAAGSASSGVREDRAEVPSVMAGRSSRGARRR